MANKIRSLRRSAIVSAVALASAVPLVLTGCTASANLTVPGSDIASVAAGSLEESVGTRPEMDCGEEQVDLVVDTEVPCVLTDPASGTEFDATVVITKVDGTDYSIDVQVAETPR